MSAANPLHDDEHPPRFRILVGPDEWRPEFEERVATRSADGYPEEMRQLGLSKGATLTAFTSVSSGETTTILQLQNGKLIVLPHHRGLLEQVGGVFYAAAVHQLDTDTPTPGNGARQVSGETAVACIEATESADAAADPFGSRFIVWRETSHGTLRIGECLFDVDGSFLSPADRQRRRQADPRYGGMARAENRLDDGSA